MARHFVPFDNETIDREFAELGSASSVDLAKLLFCLRRFETCDPRENPSPALIDSFSQGFFEIRHVKGAYKGRALYYRPDVPVQDELVILAVFRKETMKTPKTIDDRAVRRMNDDILRRKREKR